MALGKIVKKRLGMNVLQASNERIKSIFANGTKVYLDVSGGKDSIVIMNLCYQLCLSGEIDPKQLYVVFIDEEVIYDDVIRICEDWRKRFLMIGAHYAWYTIEHRNNNCFNALENNESFIPWDRYEEENWAHKKPSFAISKSPYLVPRTENYQDFLRKSQADGICIIGVRATESINRMHYLATINEKGGISGSNTMYPIYDWTDKDVWKYIKDCNLDFPDVYIKMYEAGVRKDKLRVCNLFAIDTCQALVYMFEVYPDLWEKVLKREPNAYLVRLYWDSEMFHRNTKKRKKQEAGEQKRDYRALFVDVINHPHKYFKNEHALKMAQAYKTLYMQRGELFTENDYYKAYTGLMTGDTKGRSLRALMSNLQRDYFKREGMGEKWKTI